MNCNTVKTLENTAKFFVKLVGASKTLLDGNYYHEKIAGEIQLLEALQTLQRAGVPAHQRAGIICQTGSCCGFLWPH